MRTIINYIRSCFCKHEWELIFNVEVDYSDTRGNRKVYSIKTYRCTKCGYEKKYKSH